MIFLIIFHTIISILLISVILMQASQGGGLSGSLGGQAASSILGGQSAGNVLSRITTWLAVIFISLAIIISMISDTDIDSNSTSVVKKASENIPLQQENLLPVENESVLELDKE